MTQEEWKPIKSAPYGEVLEVRNPIMEKSGSIVLASRGFVFGGMVHKDNELFTSHCTPNKFSRTPTGQMICPTEWRYPLDKGRKP